ncbi:tetratricopeptide repeat protein [Neorhodopirellula pilleata]|uniref:Tol-pal system protein YbgF n=1 Tax=Neorhodopirellula pilleata TaxID=2714738 RepID=A0A5C6A6C9_9BACT|nr:tetratricopeptide repeat protein [Neorhodopirellula pilleata]TWT95454.1 tol-pal system protein YbgF [Neorhodopirellula pilleata]
MPRIPLSRFRLVMFALVLSASAPNWGHRVNAQEAQADPAAMSIYADAANFQTNGAIDLAITQWKDFLQKYPQHELAPKAAHYLGVCYMQSDPPQLIEAARSFGVALQDQKYELREESLANRGWCFYAAAIAGDQVDKGLLQESLTAYDQLLKENPKTRYQDRAYFYSGESAYSLGKPKQAIESYSRLLQLEEAKDSGLRCDALYARGVAQEEIQDAAGATQSYQQLLQECSDTDLVVDVLLRLGDLQVGGGDYDTAASNFEKVITDKTGLATPDDQAYAMFRQAYAYVRLKKPEEAARRYETLIETFPKSDYASAALLAAAQTRYQAGDIEAAATSFRQVLAGDDPVAATEAAHWLARIELSAANAAAEGSTERTQAAQAAYDIVSRRTEIGVQGEYALNLGLDAAEALSFMKDRLPEALSKFEEFANKAPTSPLAPRALYNAAFTALSLSDHDKAIRLANEFEQRYASSELLPDTQFISAEANLMAGNATEAAKQYNALIDNSNYAGNPQRATWILRAVTAMTSAKQPQAAITLVEKNLDALTTGRQKAEALLISGQAHMQMGNASQAAENFKASREADPTWSRSDEAFLLAGQAQMTAGNPDVALGIWKQLVEESPQTRVADQARYKIGQAASAAGDFAEAISQFDPILESKRDPALIPFARYGKGWAQMQAEQYEAAAESLGQVISNFPEHPILDDALLARGIAFRNLKQYGQAKEDLTGFLQTNPEGIHRGHGLYELSLVEQSLGNAKAAADQLMTLTKNVPDYPGMDKVIYELGWSLREAGDDAAAIEQFELLMQRYPDNALLGEAAYFVGQNYYGEEKWELAANAFATAAAKADDPDLLEKSLYRLGWSQFKAGKFAEAEATFVRQFREAAGGKLYLDAMMMVGESRFKQDRFEEALRAYGKAREKIEADGDDAKTIRDPAERQVRELTLLHGGQSAAQIKDWDQAINWYDALRERFPATTYLPQVFYETGFAHQQAGNDDQAIRLYSQVADNYRNELAARARFMMGEIYFAQKEFSKAIPEFQRVMFGFGAEKAPPEIQNWQAKSGFEAGRCAELLVDAAQTESAKEKARGYARNFYGYVIEKHPNHELAAKAQERLRSLPAN